MRFKLNSGEDLIERIKFTFFERESNRLVPAKFLILNDAAFRQFRHFANLMAGPEKLFTLRAFTNETFLGMTIVHCAGSNTQEVRWDFGD